MKNFFRWMGLALLLGLSLPVVGQDRPAVPSEARERPLWVGQMQDPHQDFRLTQAYFEAYWEGRTITKGSGWKPFKRWEYYQRGRADARGRLPQPAEVFANWQAYLADHPKSATGNWQQLGPVQLPNNGTGQPNGLGRLNVVAYHPTNASILWAGAPSGGLWKTTDGGLSWTSNTDQLPTLGVSAIVVDPQNASVLYLGTGDRDAADAPGMGVMKSTDGGLNWSFAKTGIGDETVSAMLIHPDQSAELLAATSNGIYKTTNGGQSWTRVSSNFDHYKDLQYKPGNPDIVYATASGEFYRSTNGGDTWSQVTSLPSSNRMVIGVTPANPSYVYLVLTDQEAFQGLYLSTDSGASFSERSDSPNIMSYEWDGNGTGGQAWYDLCVAVDPNNANTLYVGGVNVFKSTDGGTNWAISAHWVGDNADAVHADHHYLGYSPTNGRLYSGNDGGLYYTQNGGTDWTDISSGLAIAQIYKIGQSASVAGLVMNGYQDNGTARIENGQWQTVIGGDGMECAVDPTDADYRYGSLYYGDIRRSVNGEYFSTIGAEGENGITESGGWVTPYILHETNANTMFAGYQNVWRSTNVKASSASSVSWTKISTWGTNDMRVLEQSPANPDILYAVNWDGSFRRSDNANAASPTWTTLSFPGNTPSDVEAHPTAPNVVYATAGSQVFKSADKGANWTDISGSLPDINLNTLAFDKTSNEGIYLGSETSVFYRDQSLNDWLLFDTGLPTVDVRELEIYYGASRAESRLRAGTYGRGLWDSDLFDAGDQAPVANFSASNTRPVFASEVVTFNDLTAFSPDTWSWTFSPNTVAFQQGTNANSQSPKLIFQEEGFYTVSLSVSNANGQDQTTKTNYIEAVQPSLCEASAECDEYISRVRFSNIDNSTDCGTSGYSDHRDKVANLEAGQSYTLTLNIGSFYSQDQAAAWFDWNQNLELEAGEKFVVPVASGQGQVTVAVPQTALAGSSAFRVRVAYNEAPTPCGELEWGETEDYGMLIAGGTPPSNALPPHNLRSSLVNSGADVLLEWNRPDRLPEGFEAPTFPPAGWQVLESTNGAGTGAYAPTGSTWFLCEASSFEGDGAAYIHTGQQSTAISWNAPNFQWLITPSFPAAQGDALRFWMVFLNDATQSWFSILHVKVKAGTSWGNLRTFDGNQDPDNDYLSQVELDLSGYAGQEIQLAFVFEFNDGYEMALDDIVVRDIRGLAKIALAPADAEDRLARRAHAPLEQLASSSPAAIEALTGYRILRDGQSLAQVAANQTTYTDQQPGAGTFEYCVKAIYPEGESACSNSDTETIVVTGLEGAPAISATIFPNPGAGLFLLGLRGYQGPAAVRVSDMVGRTLQQFSFNASDGVEQQIDLQGFSSGTYLVELTLGEQVLRHKLIVR